MQSRITTDSSALREAAEARMKKNPQPLLPSAEEEWRQLTQKLELRQIELEIQNEEFRQALAECEARLKHDAELFESAPVGCFNVAENGTILNVNEWATFLVHREREQLIGGQLESLVDESQRSQFRDFLRQVFATEVRLTCELTLIVAENVAIFVCAKARRSQNGTECRIVLVDVTERRRAEMRLAKSEHHLRAIFETEPECVSLLDSSGRILEMNAAGLRMLQADSLQELQDQCVYPLIEEEYRAAFQDLTQRVFEGESDVLQFKIQGLKGGHLWLEAHATPLRDEAGRVISLLSVSRDISEKKQSETIVACRTAILQSIATGRSLSDTLHLILQKVEAFSPEMIGSILLLDADGKRLRHGASLSLPTAYCEAIDGGQIGPTAGSCGTAAYRREQVIVENIATDSLWQDYRAFALGHGLHACWSTPIFDAQKRVLGTFAIYYRYPARPSDEHFRCIELTTDLAAIAICRERNEQALELSDRRYRTLVDSSIIGVIIARTDGSIAEANDYFLRMVGYTREDLNAGRLRWDAITPPEWKAIDTNAIEEIHTYGICPPIEKEYFRQDGSRVRVSVAVAQLAGTDGDCICVLTDLTERERVTEALRESEARLAAAQARAHLGSWELDLTTMCGIWSAEMFRLLRRDPALGTPSFAEFMDLIHDDDRPHLTDAQSGLGTLTGKLNLEYRTNPRTGPERHLSSTIHVIRDAAGTPVRVVGTTLDITELRHAEAAIQRYETIFLQAGWGMAIADPDSHVLTHVNPAFAKMHGYSVQEMIGMKLSNTFAAQSLQEMPKHAQIVHEKGHHTYESHHQRKDGSVFCCLTDVTAFRDTTGRVLFRAATFEDITDRKRAEEQLRQSQKMEAVGQLAGGIAHDFNNLLTVIDGYTLLLQLETNLTESEREYLKEIQTASSRAADFTRRLLAFGRQQVVSSEVIDVNSVIEETLRMLEPLISRNITRDIALDQNLKHVRADRGQISQILLNLSLNARDAMPNGGRLSIKTQNIEVADCGYPSQPETSARPYVLISVSDTGCGMSPEVQSRIFDPFFTTKPVGKGSGLGLSTVHSIVAQCGGKIELSSAPGKGSAFRIYLPQVLESEDNSLRTPELQVSRRGTETILLVEDDKALRRLTRTILKGYGYHVLEASDSASALRLCSDHTHPIQLLLTDILLPGLEGPQLAEEIIQARPGIQVLFMSGFIPDHETRHRLLTESRFLGKPFSPIELALKVRSTLDL